MTPATKYVTAFNSAVDLANRHSRSVGIEKTKEFNTTVFNVFLLPAPQFRMGHELRCEVVEPGTPKMEVQL